MAVNRTNRDANFVVTGGLTLAAQKNLDNPVTFAGAGNFLLSPNFKPAQASIRFAITGALVGRAAFDALYSDTTKVSFSNNFLTVTAVNTGGVNTSARGNADSNSNPRLFCSVTMNLVTGRVAVGICNASQANTTGLDASLNALAYVASSGAVIVNSVTLSTIETYTTSDSIDIAVDFNTEFIWFRKNGGNWNNSGAANPTTNVGGIDFSSMNAGPYYIAVEVDNTGDQVTVNFDGSFAPLVDNVVAIFYADFANQLFWYSGVTYPTFATWFTAIGGTFTRSTTAIYVNSSGLLATAAVDTIRFNYDPSTLLPKGVLLEGASTNLIANNSSPLIGGWSSASLTIAGNSSTAPDGSATATLLTSTAADACRTWQAPNGGFTPGTVYSGSCWFKAGTANGFISFDDAGGNVTAYVKATLSGAGSVVTGGSTGTATATITQFPSGWYRVTLTDTATANDLVASFGVWDGSADIFNYPGTASGKTVTVWGAQVEALRFASSYIPTTSGTVTRAGEVFYSTALTPLVSGTGTAYAKTSGNLDNGTAFNKIIGDTAGGVGPLEMGGSNTVADTYGSVDLQATIGGGGTWAGTVKVAASYDGSGRSLVANAGTLTSDAGSAPALTGIAEIGGTFGISQTIGNLAEIAAWNVRASNSELVRITS